MAVLPIDLPSGHVLIYGMGTTVSPSGISNIDPTGSLRWGSVYQIWNGGATYIYGGDNVMFNEDDVVCRLAYNNIPYTQVPAKLVTKQQPLL
jgi:hypothetical protein